MNLWDLDKQQLAALTPDAFPEHRVFETRWRDNDVWGHMNNAVYFEYFDSALNSWLLAHTTGGLADSTALQYVVESGCKYLAEVSYPSPILVGTRVAHMGNTSVVYELGIFPIADGMPGTLAALGRWAQVFVDRETRRPTAIPENIRAVLMTGMSTPR